MMNHPSTRIKRGFTLIELLVVIAIISLLVSILVPSLQKAKDLARQTVCMANQHGFSLAVVQYAQDYESIFPPSGLIMSPTWDWPHPRWYEALLPYIRSEFFDKTIPFDSLTNEFGDPCWWCPSAPEYLQLEPTNHYPQSYAYNPFLHENNKVQQAARLETVGGPDKTPVIFDYGNWNTTPWLIAAYGLYLDDIHRHNENGIFLFADSHVAQVPRLAQPEYWPEHENDFFYGHADPNTFWR